MSDLEAEACTTTCLPVTSVATAGEEFGGGRVGLGVMRDLDVEDGETLGEIIDEETRFTARRGTPQPRHR